MYSISEIAKKVDISAHTLRYYEKEGIIDPIRNDHGVRQFDEQHLKWLQFVKKLRETQMPVSQIKEYTRLFLEGEHTANARLRLLEDHRQFIRDQIETLLGTDDMLSKKISTYKELMEKSLMK
ncbi:MerR family transcriptional regulator [Pseudalkalibacillus hwajinpoensis]|uniref:MerR family transcriptional regulator n=1 Tax=Guptibacillus hwajinpoensis TaxID=208199 RepID=UPI001CD407FF|nr:MerR family transcriptional regulator [Pseudalkalibacillus hwajinpoensis]MCA0991763.1 MerR family transcriptional regulator [Pseudalkalibacillus hwajinpoensis]